MTYLKLINKVLVRLREDQVTSHTQSEYAALIGEFVNEAKTEVENAWKWINLRSTIQVTCVANTFRYTLIGAGNRFNVLDVFNDSQDVQMRAAPSTWLTSLFTTNSGTDTGNPIYYGFNGSDGTDPHVDVWPIPNTTDVLNFNMVLPQDDFTDDADTLTVPSLPVILGAYALALAERGEDGSTSASRADMKYTQALSDAIALDAINVPHETTWTAE